VDAGGGRGCSGEEGAIYVACRHEIHWCLWQGSCSRASRSTGWPENQAAAASVLSAGYWLDLNRPGGSGGRQLDAMRHDVLGRDAWETGWRSWTMRRRSWRVLLLSARDQRGLFRSGPSLAEGVCGGPHVAGAGDFAGRCLRAADHRLGAQPRTACNRVAADLCSTSAPPAGGGPARVGRVRRGR
jgi:hypothetical protein